MKKIICLVLSFLLCFQVGSAFAQTYLHEDFEWDDVAPGALISGTTTHGWTISGAYGNSKTTIQADTYQAGSTKSIRLNGDPNNNGQSVTRTFERTNGAEAGKKVEVYYRLAQNAAQATAKFSFRLYDGTNAIVNIGATYVNTGVTKPDALGVSRTVGSWVRPYCMWTNLSNPQDNMPGGDTFPCTFISTGGLPIKVAQYIKLVLDFETQKVDAYLSSSPIMDVQPNLTPVVVGMPFINTAATGVNKVEMSCPWGSKNESYNYDDIVVRTVAAAAPAEYGIDTASVAYQTEGTGVKVSADVTKGEGDALVFAAAYNGNTLLGFSATQAVTASKAYDMSIANVDEAQITKVKVFVWKDLIDCVPTCVSVQKDAN